MVKSIFLIFGHKAPKTEPKKGENFFGPTLTSFLRKIHLKIGFFWSGFSQKPVFLFSWNSKLKLSRVHILTPQELGPPFWLIWSGQEILWWPFFIFGIFLRKEGLNQKIALRKKGLEFHFMTNRTLKKWKIEIFQNSLHLA